MSKKEDDDKKYEKFVRDNASRTQMYNDILSDLISKDNKYFCGITRAENEDDFAKITIGTNFLCKYIVQLVNDMVSYVGEKNGWEESEDDIRQDIGLSHPKRYTNDALFNTQKQCDEKD